MPARNYLVALIKGKCPRCRQGNIFTHPVTRITSFNQMNFECPHCGLRLEPEPGFYQGAMYVSYAFTIAFGVMISLILYFLFNNPGEWVYVGVVIGVMVLLAPLNYRYSRILFLHFFGGISYDRRLSK